ncbi:MATE family efflux transporter [Garciella nitratireducens]|uniref:Probable multidrug resistance protein NorM n=1 Tax=Garciella nitratireducens DSM 15102 TaxID=1121911 RepID=A0A1T4NIZ7_9FIRM|nr:MATE family efflux transporter [Garciella nitratireducens]SJZ79017.1 putative efflux protein, MATE family [Garciella nitratireducens DSM 15102]
MDKEYLIHKSPIKALLIFSTPMIIGNLFQQFYTMIDSVVVGRFVSENALAAVGASYSLTNVFISIAIGGGIGASVITSRYFGGKKYTQMKQSVYTALLSFLVLSILLGILGVLFGKQIMILLNTPSNILTMATEYLKIYFLGLPFLFMYNVLSAMFNAIGRSHIPLYLLIFSSLLNVILDVYLVCFMHLGVTGVAWATLMAQGISAIISFLLFLKEFASYPSKNYNFFDKKELKNMSTIALPSILQQSTVSIGMLLVQSVVNTFGAQMLAGFSAAMRIESICIVPMAAMGNAISTYTAQNIGAKKYKRVKEGYHTAIKIVALFAVFICIILESFYIPIISLFLGSEGTQLAIKTGTSYLKFMGWFFILIGLKMVTDGLLRGAGDMKPFTIANLVNLTIRVVLAITMAPTFGIAMVWYAVPIGWLANFIISFLEYRTQRWKEISYTCIETSPIHDFEDKK